MTSFLMFIARRWCHKHEDVATEALGFLLKESRPARDVFSKHLQERFGFRLSNSFTLDTQVHSTEYGRPDMLLRVGQKSLVVVENKFAAVLTDRQQSGQYFEHLDDGGLLLFIVPEKSKKQYWERLTGCLDSRIRSKNDPNFTAEVTSADASKDRAGYRLAMTDWDTLLYELLNAKGFDDGSKNFIQELAGLCNVINQKEFTPLPHPPTMTAEERFRDFMVLSSQIAIRCFGETTKKSGQRFGDAWGDSWTGVYGSVRDQHCWIGIEANRWIEDPKHPIWLAFEGDNEILRAEKAIASGKLPSCGNADQNSRAVYCPIEIPEEMDGISIALHAKSQVETICETLNSINLPVI